MSDDSHAEADPSHAGSAPFTFRSGSWMGKAAALAMVVAFAAAVVGYWRPERTAVGLVGIAVLVGMALASAVWWRVRVDPSRRWVTRSALLVGLVPVYWRRIHAADVAAVRLHGRRRPRQWHDLWYVSLVRHDGRLMTLDWRTVVRTHEPTESWQRAGRIADALHLPLENKGLTRPSV